MILKEETVIEGKWILQEGKVTEDENCLRIRKLIESYLLKIADHSSGWNVLYKDPISGRFWEHTYPHGDWHAGGHLS